MSCTVSILQAKDAIARFGAKIDDGNVKRLSKTAFYQLCSLRLAHVRHFAEELEGVGNGTVKRAQEFLETGQIADAMAFLNDPMENMKQQLEKVYGIGPKKASDLVEAGVRSLADLKTRHELMQSELSDAQRTALRFAREIVTPIKHTTAKSLLAAVSSALKAADPKFAVEGVGGYRREEATLSDSGLNVMVTYEDYTFDDPDNVANFRKKSAEENNQGPSVMRAACKALEDAGLLVAHIEGGHLKHSVLLMEKSARAKYDMPAPLMQGADEGGSDAEEPPAESSEAASTPAASGAGVAAAGLAIPDLDDAEDAAETGAPSSTAGLWKKHGGLSGARAASSSSFGGRKRRADGPDVQLMDKAELEAAAKAAEEADELTPVEGPCPHMVVLHAVPINFAGAARFFMTGPDDYVLTVAREVRVACVGFIVAAPPHFISFRRLRKSASRWASMPCERLTPLNSAMVPPAQLGLGVSLLNCTLLLVSCICCSPLCAPAHVRCRFIPAHCCR